MLGLTLRNFGVGQSITAFVILDKQHMRLPVQVFNIIDENFSL